MSGMDATTGRAMDGLDHVRQSIGNILSTRIGRLVAHRDYGSRLYELVDDPVDQRFEIEVFMAVAEALRRWEPRVRTERIQLLEMRDNGPVFRLDLVYLPDGRRTAIDV